MPDGAKVALLTKPCTAESKGWEGFGRLTLLSPGHEEQKGSEEAVDHVSPCSRPGLVACHTVSR